MRLQLTVHPLKYRGHGSYDDRLVRSTLPMCPLSSKHTSGTADFSAWRSVDSQECHFASMALKHFNGGDALIGSRARAVVACLQPLAPSPAAAQALRCLLAGCLLAYCILWCALVAWVSGTLGACTAGELAKTRGVLTCGMFPDALYSLLALLRAHKVHLCLPELASDVARFAADAYTCATVAQDPVGQLLQPVYTGFRRKG